MMSRDCQGVKYFGWVAKCNVKYRNLRERKNEICFKLFRNDRTKIHLPNNLNINSEFSNAQKLRIKKWGTKQNTLSKSKNAYNNGATKIIPA